MRIARESIDPDADKVVRRLSRHGYQAYLVGGCVRDLLLSRTPKDFDVATSATPKETKQLFRNCRIIGRRFRLAHIFFGGKIIETSTFRANPRQDEHEGELLIRRDNVFGSDTEDARRRDFTINGLFYDVEEEKVIDYVGGLKDLKAKTIATIGNPDIRFQEDPVRMLRAIKFAARLDFSIDKESYQAILRQKQDITKCAQPRVLEELYRLLRSGAAKRSVELLLEVGFAEILSETFKSIFSQGIEKSEPKTTMIPESSSEASPPPESPATPWDATWSEDSEESKPATLSALPDGSSNQDEQAWKILGEFDRLAKEGKEELSNCILISSICAPFILPDILAPDLRPVDVSEIIDDILAPLCEDLQVARRDAEKCKNILLAMRRLAPSRRRRGRPMAFVRRDYFPEALLVYEIAGRITGHLPPASAEYWRKLQSEGGHDANSRPEKRRRRKRGGRRRRRDYRDVDDGEQQESPRRSAKKSASQKSDIKSTQKKETSNRDENDSQESRTRRKSSTTSS